jgi:hypothetical protein
VTQFASQPFVLLGVNTDTERETPLDLQKDGTVTWQSWWNGPRGLEGPITSEWDIEGFPTIFLIDAKGVVRYRSDGVPPKGELEKKINELLKEMK